LVLKETLERSAILTLAELLDLALVQALERGYCTPEVSFRCLIRRDLDIVLLLEV
jgi:hypothetical protein